MTVIFEDINGDRHEIGQGKNFQSSCKIIHDFLIQRHYRPSYWRFSLVESEVMVDVGSWNEFFYIEVDSDFDLDSALRSGGD